MTQRGCCPKCAATCTLPYRWADGMAERRRRPVRPRRRADADRRGAHARLGGDVHRLPRPASEDVDGRPLALHRRGLLRPRRRQAALRRRRGLLRSRGIDLPEGEPDRPARAETVCGLGNRKNARSTSCSTPTASALPRLGGAARPPARAGDPARGRLLLGERARGARGGRPGRPVRHRRRRRGWRPTQGLAGKPAPDTFVHAADEAAASAGPLRSWSRTPSRGSPPGPPGDSGWSSASTAGPAPTPCASRGRRGRRRPRRAGPVSACARRGPRQSVGHRPTSTRSTAAASPSTRGGWSSATTTAHDLGVTETLFAVAQRLPRHARQPRGGARRATTHGTFVNGFHETWPIRHAEEAFGFARTGQTIVNVPDAKR